MSEELISVKLYSNDVKRMENIGFISLYGIDPIDAELQLGRSEIPEKWLPLFCEEGARANFPDFYIRAAEPDFQSWCGDDEFVYTQRWYDCWHKACASRHAPDHWTISSGDYLYVFPNVAQCLLWLKSRKNYEGIIVRDPSGTRKKIQVSIELVDQS